MLHNGNGRQQIEFPPKQSHSKRFETAIVALSVLCIVIVLVIVLFTGLGNETRPTV